MEHLLETTSERKFYENWRTDIFIIKRYREIYNSFKEQILQGKGKFVRAIS